MASKELSKVGPEVVGCRIPSQAHVKHVVTVTLVYQKRYFVRHLGLQIVNRNRRATVNDN